MNADQPTVEIEEAMCPEEKKLREELALTYRVCHLEDLCEGTSNHLSVCLEEKNAILTLPFGLIWSTVKPEDFVLIDFDGKILRKSARHRGESMRFDFVNMQLPCFCLAPVDAVRCCPL